MVNGNVDTGNITLIPDIVSAGVKQRGFVMNAVKVEGQEDRVVRFCKTVQLFGALLFKALVK